MDTAIQLIVGLGNPGPDYEKTRHNAGVWLVEALAKQHHASFRNETKFKGQSCVITLDGHECQLFLPTTFMNNNGRSVRAIANFYQIPPQAILIVHDDLDLPVGVVRLKRAGGHGGHNGLRDVIANLGSAEFMRLRLGIGHPGDGPEVVDYVLNKPSRADNALIHKAIEEALCVLPLVVAGDIGKAMNQLHTDNPKFGS